MLGMLGTWQSSRASSGATELGSPSGSPLASQLQQAWLESQSSRQSSRQKLQKRGFAQDAHSHQQQQFHQVASDLSSIVADHASVQSYAVTRSEDLYFHKSRHETPEFPKRPVFPQLVSYSRKQELPQRSRSGNFDSGFTSSASSSLSDLSSQRSGSLSPSGSFTSCDFGGDGFDDAIDAVDSEYELADALDHLAAHTEPLVRFLDMDESNVVNLSLQEDLAYQAMAKEFDDLVGPEMPRTSAPGDEELPYDNSWTTAGFVPTEESVTDKFIHAYTCNLNKHVTDVSGNVDASTWINEGDACTDHSDGSWDWDLECIRAKSDRRSSQCTSLHQDFSLSREMSLDSFSFTPGCVDLKGLLLRYMSLLCHNG